jgi:hypothetical protein
MSRGKKGYRARSYSGYRRARVAPRGRMSVRFRWPVYGLIAAGVLLLAGWGLHHFLIR